MKTIRKKILGKHLDRFLRALDFYFSNPCAKTREFTKLVMLNFFIGTKKFPHSRWDDFYKRHYGETIAVMNFIFKNYETEALAVDCSDIIYSLYPNEENIFNSKMPLPDIIDTNGDGPYETEDVQIKESNIVIDAGANMGIFSVLAASKGAYVYAFEPQHQILDTLFFNIKTNGFENRIAVIPLGLSNKPCTVEFSEVDDGKSSSRMSDFANNKLMNKIRVARSYEIECTSIDKWVNDNNIKRIDFIKADIEGAERLMLTGAKETMARFKPRLAICSYHLPDDPQILATIIKEANPAYQIDQRKFKLFAW
jgi:FkbM family methyltransferase